MGRGAGGGGVGGGVVAGMNNDYLTIYTISILILIF